MRRRVARLVSADTNSYPGPHKTGHTLHAEGVAYYSLCVRWLCVISFLFIREGDMERGPGS